MKPFLVLLALASGLLLLESKADDTPQYCKDPKADVVALVEALAAQGFRHIELKGSEAQAYLSVLREVTEVPAFPGTELSIVLNENVAAVAFVFKDDTRCGYVRVSWPLHVRALKSAKGIDI
jgi:hypothetical protein